MEMIRKNFLKTTEYYSLTRSQLTKEKEAEKLPFLDVLVNRRGNGTLEHHLYQKLNHTNCYLHKDSNLYPPNVEFSKLAHLATRICETKPISLSTQRVSGCIKKEHYTHKEES